MVVGHLAVALAGRRASQKTSLGWFVAAATKFGLGLWHAIPATMLVEGLLWIACLTIYLRTRLARSCVAVLALWCQVLVVTALGAMGPFSPPPPSVRALALVALAGGWITVPWADRGYVERSTA
jgi:hypothetical protein